MKKRLYTSIELFAGAGGLALGLELAGFNHLLLNDIDKYATQTLKNNKKEWNVLCEDVSKVDFKNYKGQIDLLTGGFPCQTFSYAGKRMGFKDARGTMFFEFARAIKEVEPKVIMFENVKGLVSHNKGKTLNDIISVLEDLGYYLFEYKVLNALDYGVPQKRQRIIVVGVKNDYKDSVKYKYPEELDEKYNLLDAFKAGKLYDTDVPVSNGQSYPLEKKSILELVPPGGCWRDLPVDLQKSYMKKSFYLGGGRTGMARRISWNEPSLTLTCSPAQKQTERCHPDETRPFTVREYARIQTFPDNWEFAGSMSQQYKQIGNAVPVNLGYHIGLSLKALLNDIYNIT